MLRSSESLTDGKRVTLLAGIRAFLSLRGGLGQRGLTMLSMRSFTALALALILLLGWITGCTRVAAPLALSVPHTTIPVPSTVTRVSPTPTPTLKPTVTRVPSTVTPMPPTSAPTLAPTSAATPRLSPTFAEILAHGEKVPFEVCGESTSWVRPSEEQQASKWGGRYAGANEEVTKYPWTHNFFVVYGSASIESDIENLSGLWTVQGGERGKCFEPERHDAILKLQTAEVWALLHKVNSIKRLDTSYVIVVEPGQRGVQFVQFPRPSGWLPLTLYFVTSDGQEVEKIAEADYMYWPYPQLVPTPQP